MPQVKRLNKNGLNRILRPCAHIWESLTHNAFRGLYKKSNTAACPLRPETVPLVRQAYVQVWALWLSAHDLESYMHSSLWGHREGSMVSHRSPEEPKAGQNLPVSLVTAKYVCQFPSISQEYLHLSSLT